MVQQLTIRGMYESKEKFCHRIMGILATSGMCQHDALFKKCDSQHLMPEKFWRDTFGLALPKILWKKDLIYLSNKFSNLINCLERGQLFMDSNIVDVRNYTSSGWEMPCSPRKNANAFFRVSGDCAKTLLYLTYVSIIAKATRRWRV